MQKLILSVTVLLLTNLCNAQNNQELISSSGEDFSNGTNQISWSIGEVVITTASTSANIITQGFHQTNLSVVGVKDFTLNSTISVFPNPTTELLTIEVEEFSGLKYHLFDMNGKIISEKNLSETTTSITLIDEAKGTYLLKIFDLNSNKSKSYKIIKK